MKKLRGYLILLAVGCTILLPAAAHTDQNDKQTAKEALAEVQKRLTGHEDEPAEKVFTNIQVLKGKKAARLPGMMSALTGLLGVDCSHCHVPGKWESEEKPAKQITRQHFSMQAEMNQKYFG